MARHVVGQEGMLRVAVRVWNLCVDEGRRCGACWRRKQRRCLLGTRAMGGDVVFRGGGCAPERGESRKALSHCRPVRKGKIFQRWSAEAFLGSGGGGRAFCVPLAGRRRFSADIDRERDGWASGGIFSAHCMPEKSARSALFADEGEDISNGEARRRFQAAEEVSARFASGLQAGGGFRRTVIAREMDGRLAAYFLHTACRRKSAWNALFADEGEDIFISAKVSKN